MIRMKRKYYITAPKVCGYRKSLVPKSPRIWLCDNCVSDHRFSGYQKSQSQQSRNPLGNDYSLVINNNAAVTADQTFRRMTLTFKIN